MRCDTTCSGRQGVGRQWLDSQRVRAHLVVAVSEPPSCRRAAAVFIALPPINGLLETAKAAIARTYLGSRERASSCTEFYKGVGNQGSN